MKAFKTWSIPQKKKMLNQKDTSINEKKKITEEKHDLKSIVQSDSFQTCSREKRNNIKYFKFIETNFF